MSSLYTVREGQLYYGARALGPAGHVYFDATQPGMVEEATVHRVHLERGDYVTSTNAGHIMLVEEKRLPDLVGSWRSRRLQRQLRHLLASNPDGLNVLALRAPNYLGETLQENQDIVAELLKWQTLGGLLGMLPESSSLVFQELRRWRAVLQPGQGLFSILAGDDRPKRASREPMTPCGAALRAVLQGVGYKTGKSWAAAAGENLLRALSMSEEELSRAGVNKTTRARLAKLLEQGELE